MSKYIRIHRALFDGCCTCLPISSHCNLCIRPPTVPIISKIKSSYGSCRLQCMSVDWTGRMAYIAGVSLAPPRAYFNHAKTNFLRGRRVCSRSHDLINTARRWRHPLVIIVIGCLHHRANVEQTSSKHRAASSRPIGTPPLAQM